jgi:DNA-binding beta-propeller fold protein YncE
MRQRIAIASTACLLALASVSARQASTGRIFYLDIGGGGRVLSANADGSDVQIVSKSRASGPDGIVVDPVGKHIYWTTMGAVSKDDGTIERVDLDGGNGVTIVHAGGTFTPKQLKVDRAHGKLYWSDREGLRVMRANLDGSRIETLVETAQGEEARRDARNWCVGIAVDVERGKVYWTPKGSGGNGRILRANLEIPKGETAARRSDIEVLFAGLPEPIDMDVDLSTRLMYWTDRGDPPNGNTVSRAPMDPPADVDPGKRSDQQILFGGLREGIGISLDLQRGRMFVTDLGGNIYSARLDGSDRKTILTGQGTLTGIAYVDLSK